MSEKRYIATYLLLSVVVVGAAVAFGERLAVKALGWVDQTFYACDKVRSTECYPSGGRTKLARIGNTSTRECDFRVKQTSIYGNEILYHLEDKSGVEDCEEKLTRSILSNDFNLGFRNQDVGILQRKDPVRSVVGFVVGREDEQIIPDLYYNKTKIYSNGNQAKMVFAGWPSKNQNYYIDFGEVYVIDDSGVGERQKTITKGLYSTLLVEADVYDENQQDVLRPWVPICVEVTRKDSTGSKSLGKTCYRDGFFVYSGVLSRQIGDMDISLDLIKISTDTPNNPEVSLIGDSVTKKFKVIERPKNSKTKGVIGVSVVDSHGTPIKGALVKLHSLDHGTIKKTTTRRTNNIGNASFAGLKNGRNYKIDYVVPKGYSIKNCYEVWDGVLSSGDERIIKASGANWNALTVICSE